MHNKLVLSISSSDKFIIHFIIFMKFFAAITLAAIFCLSEASIRNLQVFDPID